MWLLFTLLSATLFGVGQVFTKKGLDETSPLLNNLLGAGVTLLITVPFALMNGAHISFVPKVLPITLVIALLLLCYYYIIAKGQVSLTGTILASYPLITIALSLLFLHEQPSLFQKIAIALILLGTIVIVAGENLNAFKRLQFGGWFYWALGGAIAIGTGDFLTKIAINRSDMYTYLLAYGIAFGIVAGSSYFFDKKGRRFPKLTNTKFLPTLIGVTMLETGVVVFYRKWFDFGSRAVEFNLCSNNSHPCLDFLKREDH